MSTIQEEAQILVDESKRKRQTEQIAKRLEQIEMANQKIVQWKKEIEQIEIAPIPYEEGESRRY